jgi:hypothetical protein
MLSGKRTTCHLSITLSIEKIYIICKTLGNVHGLVSELQGLGQGLAVANGQLPAAIFLKLAFLVQR